MGWGLCAQSPIYTNNIYYNLQFSRQFSCRGFGLNTRVPLAWSISHWSRGGLTSLWSSVYRRELLVQYLRGWVGTFSSPIPMHTGYVPRIAVLLKQNHRIILYTTLSGQSECAQLFFFFYGYKKFWRRLCKRFNPKVRAHMHGGSLNLRHDYRWSQAEIEIPSATEGKKGRNSQRIT